MSKSHCTYLSLPDGHKTKLKELQKSLMDEAHAMGLKEVNLDEALITLSSFTLTKKRKKESEKELINSTRKLLQNMKKPKVEIKFGELGCFGPRVLFLRVKMTEELEDLKYDVDELLESVGIQVIDTRFFPHVTLFRLPSGKVGHAEGVENLVDATVVRPLKNFTVEDVLFKTI